MNQINHGQTDVSIGLTPRQLITAAATLTRALATATREYLGSDADGEKFELRHGEAILIIGSRGLLIEHGTRKLKPMTPKRFQDHFEKHYGATTPTTKRDRLRLEGVGLIMEAPDPTDGRQTIIKLTDEGQMVFEGFATTLASISLVINEMLENAGPLPAEPHRWAGEFIRDFSLSMITAPEETELDNS